MREWHYWTENKLDILNDYLPAFNVAASGKSPERIYLDLLAGEPVNISKRTGQAVDGSPRVAMKAGPPGFTRLAFCEMDTRRAGELRADLQSTFPNDARWALHEGDCNEVIDQMLAPLQTYRWAPTFAFIDQQGAEVSWRTLGKVARFRSGARKTETWILVSPAMIVKGVAGTNHEAFQDRVDAMFGSFDWRRIQAARDADFITAEEYRDEMVNLIRWRLHHVLGYAFTSRIPMRMTNGSAIYDMVFATDHFVGEKIMTSVYQRAAEREPKMMNEVRLQQKAEKDAKAGVMALFEFEPDDAAVIKAIKWEPEEAWDPTTRPWW